MGSSDNGGTRRRTPPFQHGQLADGLLVVTHHSTEDVKGSSAGAWGARGMKEFLQPALCGPAPLSNTADPAQGLKGTPSGMSPLRGICA